MRIALVLLVLAIGTSVSAPARARSDRFTGLWEGQFHGGLGDQAMALVVRPRGAAGFAGTMYQEGLELGPVESGRIAGDSLLFSLMSFDFVALRSGERLAVDFTVRHGNTHHFEMTRTSSDTTRRPAVPAAAARAAAGIPHEPVPDSVYRAHAVAPGEPASLASCLGRGTLMLVGGGPTQDDLDARFVELAGGDRARIVVIPTAAIVDTDPNRPGRFAELLRAHAGKAKVSVLHTTSRREADSEAFVAPLKAATGVWIPGGEGSWLLDSYLGTRTERELIAVLERGGVVGGTSAGAVIWASTLMAFREDTTHRELQPMRVENLVIGDPHDFGIGLLRNVTIAPHLNAFHLEPSLRKMVDSTPGLLGIGIDEATALEVHGGEGRVLGRGTVVIYPGSTARPPAVLKSGARYDLIHRQAL